MKIGIVDDHKLLVQSYKLILKDFECVIEAFNGLDMIKKFEKLSKSSCPDVIIVDINMPLMDGFETVAWLKANHPNIKIIVVTVQNDDNSILRMIKLGANSYLTKNDLEPEELNHAILEVVKKGNYFTNNITELIIESFQNSNLTDIERKIQSLSYREISILKLICEEHSSVEIAEISCISVRTVETHVKNMLDKLNIKTRVGLALFAYKYGLLN